MVYTERDTNRVSNFIVRPEDPSSKVADNMWKLHLGLGALLLGALAGGLGSALVPLYFGRRAKLEGPKDWPVKMPVNIAHRGGKCIAPENTIVGFRAGLNAGADVLELEVHLTADGHLVVIHDDKVDRTTNGSGLIREKTLQEIKLLDAGYKFPGQGSKTYPYRGQGVVIPTLEEVYQEFPDVATNVEIKEDQPGIEQALWQVIEEAEAAERTLVVSGNITFVASGKPLVGKWRPVLQSGKSLPSTS